MRTPRYWGTAEAEANYYATLGTLPASDSSCSWWHCGRRWRTLPKLKTSCWRGRSSRKLARASERVRPWPHVTTPAGMGCAARWGRCVNGAKFYIKLTSPADLVWKGGPTVFRCDGAFARRHKVPGVVKRRPRRVGARSNGRQRG